MCCIISYNILYKTNNFEITKGKSMLLLIKPINKTKSSYIDAFDRKNLANIDKKMPDKSKVAKMLKVKLIISKNKYIISF